MADEALEAVEEPVLDVATYLDRIGFHDTTEPSLACLTGWAIYPTFFLANLS